MFDKNGTYVIPIHFKKKNSQLVLSKPISDKTRKPLKCDKSKQQYY